MSGRVVLVTGASGGIGGACAASFARNGDKVVLIGNKHFSNAQSLAYILEQEGHSVLALQADVASESAVDLLFEKVEEQLGSVEILLNAAGTAQQKLFCDITVQEWDAIFNASVKSTFLCSKRALPSMIQKKDGCIINIASMWGQVGASCESHYAAAKAAVISLTKSLAKEEGPSGIRVNCIAPGAIDTAMMADFSVQDKKALCEEIPLGRLGTPQDIAGVAVFLASDNAAYITGQVLAPNGGMVV